jgi:hypothetical protein
MADEQDQDDQNDDLYSYDYSADGEPAGSGGDPVDCPACRGTGKEMLLFIARPCKACGGTGKIASAAPTAGSTDSTSSPHAGLPQADPGTGADAPDDKSKAREERVPGHWVSTSTYDHLERLRSRVEQFVPDATP